MSLTGYTIQALSSSDYATLQNGGVVLTPGGGTGSLSQQWVIKPVPRDAGVNTYTIQDAVTGLFAYPNTPTANSLVKVGDVPTSWAFQRDSTGTYAIILPNTGLAWSTGTNAGISITSTSGGPTNNQKWTATIVAP